MNYKHTASIGLLILATLAIGCEKKLTNPTVESEVEASTQYEQLKNFDWLIGDWEDEDEDVKISSNYQWGDNKNYLVNKFTVAVAGKDELKGQQIILWDPIENQVRSWVFDSDGGFGEGSWSKQGDQWYVKMKFTRPDGQRASATNIYKKIDDSTYTFSSQGRDVNGAILPNVGPFKVVRK